MSEPQPTDMQYVRLGKSGLKVSRIILGCMSYGYKGWAPWILGETEGIEHIKAAYDLGINAFDTSNSYSNGESERILGKAIKQHNLPRDEIVVMTKVYTVVGRGEAPLWFAPVDQLEKDRYVNQRGLSRKHIFESVKHSLERLQLDYIDVLQCHRFDYLTPVEETMQALHDVVQAGYVRYIGISSCYAWQLQKMQYYARANGLTQFISMQNFHCPVYREEEREMTPLLKDLGMGMIPWSPLAGGFTASSYKKIGQAATTTRQETDAIRPLLVAEAAKSPWLIEINQAIEAIATKRGVSMAQVSLAWSLSKDFMTAPIVGTTSIDKLKDCCAAVHLKLTEEEIKSIDSLYQPRPIFGHS